MIRKGWVLRLAMSAVLFATLIAVSTRVVGPTQDSLDLSMLSGASVEQASATVPMSTKAEPAARPQSLSIAPVTYAVENGLDEVAPVPSLNMLAAFAAAAAAAAVLSTKVSERRGARRR